MTTTGVKPFQAGRPPEPADIEETLDWYDAMVPVCEGCGDLQHDCNCAETDCDCDSCDERRAADLEMTEDL